MNYHIECPCGESVQVGEGSAGVTLKCTCGRPILVPSVDKLRQSAGLPPAEPSPELVLRHMLAAGELPPSRECARCGVLTDNVATYEVQCETATRKGGAGFWFRIFLILNLSPLALFKWGEETVIGENKIFHLPIALCEKCQPSVRGSNAIKEILFRVREYARLLKKFPDAVAK